MKSADSVIGFFARLVMKGELTKELGVLEKSQLSFFFSFF